MLVAVDSTGVRRTASAQLATSTFCPACQRQLVVRVPSRRVAHFAHRPGEKCDTVALRALRAAARREKTRAARAAALSKATADAGQDALFDLAGAPDPAPAP